MIYLSWTFSVGINSFGGGEKFHVGVYVLFKYQKHFSSSEMCLSSALGLDLDLPADLIVWRP
jgi:hypothetical protein